MVYDVFILGIVFIFIHLFANKLIPVNRIQRLHWFSFSGGLAVSYVFVYSLPSLHKEQQQLKQYGGHYVEHLAMESELYFIGLLGVLLFLWIHRNF